MIDATPRYLLIWGSLSDEKKHRVITKFGGFDKFDIRKPEVQNFIVQNFGNLSKYKTVVTK